MISRAQMEVYAKYDGDVDARATFARSAERGLISEAVWRQVDRFREDLGRVRAGLATPEYAARVEREVAAAFSDPVALSILARLVDADGTRTRAAG